MEVACDWRPAWVFRGNPGPNDAQPVLAKLAKLTFPEGDGYVWISGESGATQALRKEILDRGHPREWVRASGYWKLGAADTHDKFD